MTNLLAADNILFGVVAVLLIANMIMDRVFKKSDRRENERVIARHRDILLKEQRHHRVYQQRLASINGQMLVGKETSDIAMIRNALGELASLQP